MKPFKGNPFAKAGLDLAWWDLEGKLRGEPVHRLLAATSTAATAPDAPPTPDRCEIGADFGVQDSLDDLVQVASFGLIRAVERYDPEVGTAFAGFAVPTMVGEIKRHFRDRTWTLHVGRPTKDLLPRLRDATDLLTAELGRAPSATELAGALDVSVDAILHAFEARGAYRAGSLSTPADGTDREARANRRADDRSADTASRRADGAAAEGAFARIRSAAAEGQERGGGYNSGHDHHALQWLVFRR